VYSEDKGGTFPPKLCNVLRDLRCHNPRDQRLHLHPKRATLIRFISSSVSYFFSHLFLCLSSCRFPTRSCFVLSCISPSNLQVQPTEWGSSRFVQLGLRSTPLEGARGCRSSGWFLLVGVRSTCLFCCATWPEPILYFKQKRASSFDPGHTTDPQQSQTIVSQAPLMCDKERRFRAGCGGGGGRGLKLRQSYKTTLKH
jgi:hypothetical protein